jgi:hypothetical protein
MAAINLTAGWLHDCAYCCGRGYSTFVFEGTDEIRRIVILCALTGTRLR